MRDDEVLVTVRLPTEIAENPTSASVAAFLGIAVSKVNAAFGVVPIDPKNGLFSLMMPLESLEALPEDIRTRVEGPFANPKIAPFRSPE